MKFITLFPFPVKKAKNRKLRQTKSLHRLHCGKKIILHIFLRFHNVNSLATYCLENQILKGLFKQTYKDLTYIIVLET